MKIKQNLLAKTFFLLTFNCILIFVNAQTWVQEGQDIDGEAASDQSGNSVSLSSDGSIVAIGAYTNDGTGGSAGHVRIYENNSGIWTQIGSDIDGEAAGDQSGISVSLSFDGSIVAIGAFANDGTGSSAGHVRIYENNSGTWTQIGSDIDGEAAGDLSGISVSLSSDGSVVAIGANQNDGNGSNAGHVRIYQNIAGTWTQIGADIDGEAAGDHSGISVSLSSDGSVVAIGAYQNDGNGLYSGHVRIYQNNAGIWTQIGGDIDGEAAVDYFGYSVSLSSDGSIVAVGAYGNNGNGTTPDAGHVRIYQNNAGIWTQIGGDIDGEAQYDISGWSVSLSSDGSIVAVGAIENDGNGINAGHVRVYQNISGIWTQIRADIDGETFQDQFGYSVSLSSNGSTVAAGAVFNDGNGSNSGHVRIFSVPPVTITQQPADHLNVCSSLIVDFSVTGENIDNYQWQVSTNGGSIWSDISDDATYSGALTGTLSVTSNTGLNNYQYRCYVSNPLFNETSDAALLTVIESVSNPVPADLSVGVSLNQDISWDAAPGALSYDVYFGESGSMAFVGNQTDLFYDPGLLNYTTDHEWQILTVTAVGTASVCHIWTFTTLSNPGPPAEGGIAVNDDGSSPNVYAIFDASISTHNKGILIPKLTTVQRTGLTGLGPTEDGLTVYDTDTKCFWLWDGTQWKQFSMTAKKDDKIIELEKIIKELNKKIESLNDRINNLEKNK